MTEPIVCPACGTRMRRHRPRCLRCGTPLPVRGAARWKWHPPAWLVAQRWRVAGGVLAFIVFVGAIVAWQRLGKGEAAGAAVVPAAAGAGELARPRPSTHAVAAARPPLEMTMPALADPAASGRHAFQGGEFETAFNRFRAAVERNPGDAESMSNCGQALVRMGKPAEAVEYFERAIGLNERRWAYHFNLAHARGVLNEWDRAVESYRKAADLFPDDFVTEYNLGMALHKQGDEAAAVDHFRRATELQPGEADFHLSLGISSESLKRPADAVAAYTRYLELAPASAQSGAVRARVEALSRVAGQAR